MGDFVHTWAVQPSESVSHAAHDLLYLIVFSDKKMTQMEPKIPLSHFFKSN
ncbi:hypothetical protein BSG1_09978 [Bacillus sp. SG-1]|nr:hypothetical protein BSG1_09978 [Bacillus sp. SG-1]